MLFAISRTSLNRGSSVYKRHSRYRIHFKCSSKVQSFVIKSVDEREAALRRQLFLNVEVFFAEKTLVFPSLANKVRLH